MRTVVAASAVSRRARPASWSAPTNASTPRHIANGVFLYPLEELEAVFRRAQEIGPRVPRTVELMVFIHCDLAGEPEIAVTAPALVDDAAEAAAALSLLETCPARERASDDGEPADGVRLVAVRTEMPAVSAAMVDWRALPDALAPALARHCAEEYANLGALLRRCIAPFPEDGGADRSRASC
ncbi:MAG TPA: hypothetical protein VHE08_00935 [Solirubrobacterales bacterium]|nr:hypothetical protein [Solirubrobacterales bacterium]